MPVEHLRITYPALCLLGVSLWHVMICLHAPVTLVVKESLTESCPRMSIFAYLITTDSIAYPF
jgi:hypothetical protein